MGIRNFIFQFSFGKVWTLVSLCWLSFLLYQAYRLQLVSMFVWNKPCVNYQCIGGIFYWRQKEIKGFWAKLKISFTCQGQFPGTALTPPITRVMGETPHFVGPGGTIKNVINQENWVKRYLIDHLIYLWSSTRESVWSQLKHYPASRGFLVALETSACRVLKHRQVSWKHQR